MNSIILNRDALLRRVVSLRRFRITRRLQHQQIHQTLSSSSARESQDQTTVSASSPLIDSKQACLDQFKLMSERFYADLKNSSGKVDFEERSIEIRMARRQSTMDVQARYSKSPITASILAYVNKNFENFNVKEKAVMFKIFAMMKNSLSSSEITPLLNKLETDIYEQNFDECSFLDYINYRDGLFYNRLVYLLSF